MGKSEEKRRWRGESMPRQDFPRLIRRRRIHLSWDARCCFDGLLISGPFH